MHNPDDSAVFAYYIRSIENSPDLQCLDQTYCRAVDYIFAKRKTGALPTEQIQALTAVFDHLYQQRLNQLRMHGTDLVRSSGAESSLARSLCSGQGSG